ncbi:ArsR/SmtB family transcription factor [Gimesia algae]|uniref:Transcriptional repressor SdpR n=1 Tax=Gimesia algae TaxID=2527971 RepID=A0A517VKU4_9PLAN|nr:metalloregulator ArsR/SmtB family transcription factor [Gimesia algae]QDT93641.1 Transcriptional repressor SdpR [Gimesia algae]
MKYLDADTFQADYCAERLKALGEPLRLRIVNLLRSGEFTVSDIAEFLETEVVTVSHHLQILKNSKIVSPRREGRYIYYRLHSELFQNCNESNHYLDLGCCRIEMAE